MAVTSIEAHTAYTLCFDSTLYTSPILDLLLADVPEEWHFILRLGLQEALVNAVKHGNQLDSSRQVTIEFFMSAESYHWVVKDQGTEIKALPEPQAPCLEAECGRGVYIMHQIFDYVYWNQNERQLHLRKQVKSSFAIAC
ncbi:ATP-binding protein [Synechococcus sp. PCC 7502]|uniref:ATP-binding protein n=1 Tax=Synechococcus sp. PCC 7502 TaxID=1173263 RepID=UPI001FEFF54C|nr:ATP-binding protein [Synechococcus sp. PCC 7502]